MLIDFLGEMSSSFRWFYSGWLMLLSPIYRENRRRAWIGRPCYKKIDIFFMFVFSIAEVTILVLVMLD